jgi:hypothetical protein
MCLQIYNLEHKRITIVPNSAAMTADAPILLASTLIPHVRRYARY